jgi:hypothetical protein
LAMLHGTEAVIPLSDGPSVPVQLGGTASGLADLASAVNQMQSTFSAAMSASKSSADTQAGLPKEQIKELPAAFTAALETVLSGPAGLVEAMTSVKSQSAEDNKTNVGMLQQQNDNLTKIVDAMNENVDYSRRIANDLS